jgi:alkylation response protein AidB-like acyl-CoA dehydrogenase
MFAEAVEDILKSHCAPAQVRQIERGGSWKPLAEALEASGFHALLAPEAQGGAGASWRDFQPIVELAGAWSLPLPLASTLAARCLVKDSRRLPDGPLTFAPFLRAGPDGGVRASHVPFLRTSKHVLGVFRDEWVYLPVAASNIQASGIHGTLTASIEWSTPEIQVVETVVTPDRLQSIAALLFGGLLVGAMRRSFELTLDYANQRVQFGRTIGKFQAVQHQLAVMAEQIAAARMAVQAGFASGETGIPTEEACAVAKARASEAAAQVAAIAHAVHGAIGVTEEYDLQLSTRRLHEWRAAHGSESYWHRLLGQRLWASPASSAVDFARGLLA